MLMECKKMPPDTLILSAAGEQADFTQTYVELLPQMLQLVLLWRRQLFIHNSHTRDGA